MLARVLITVGSIAMAASGAPLKITEEPFQIKVLQTIFPGAEISATSQRIPLKAGERDAFAAERVYRVVGPPLNEAERAAAEDVASSKVSNERRVRLLAYRWPGEGDAGLLAVLQYDFAGVVPAGCCWSIGRLAHLVRSGGIWRVRDRHLLQTQHHSTVEAVGFLDDRTLLVESDVGGAATSIVRLSIFDLSRGTLDDVQEGESVVEHDVAVDDTDQSIHYSERLDLRRTANAHGRQFCFVRTVTMQNK